jgi:hypothetical protein
VDDSSRGQTGGGYQLDVPELGGIVAVVVDERTEVETVC